ncbi:hypothetical protein [Synechococcus sp. 1G10]|uniref:hypothetical protein n=1 Tax=Synechococcus sp. 1G10 TaxID=2025605 RepID=UPI000B986501|nr:hypothetical protein [Synechococcus sp. 1G10]
MNRFVAIAAAVALTVSPVCAQTPIRFAAGSDSGLWAGYVTSGHDEFTADKSFALGMAKGQRIWLSSEQVYTWTVVTPSGRELGCGGGSYCAPNDKQGVRLPESGNYTIRTTYRMGSGAASQPAPRRYATVMFTVR